MHPLSSLVLVCSLFIASCGGGDPSAAEAPSRRPLVAPTAAGSTPSLEAGEVARQLMDWAEQEPTYGPLYFPTHEFTQAAAPFHYRYYPGSGVYLGVAAGGDAAYVDGVYVMGGSFGASPIRVGAVSGFITPVAPASTLSNSHFTWVPLSSDSRAVCNDGSPAGYYLRPSATGSTRWVIMLRGGGYCRSMDAAGGQACDPEKDPGCRPSPSCLERSAELAGSGGYAATLGNTQVRFLPLSNDPATNPDFADANHVYVPYCSSDLHRGDGQASYTVDGIARTMHFRGRRIVATVITQLKSTTYTPAPTIAGASEVLVGGSSAGGLGVLANLDAIAAALPGVTLRGVVDSGWLPDVEPYPGADSIRTRLGEAVALWGGLPDDSCVTARGNAAECYLGPLVLPHVQTPLFVYMAQRDTNLVDELAGADLAAPYDTTETGYISAFGSAVKATASKASGYFLPDSTAHTALSTPARFATDAISSTTYRSALGNWFFGRTGSTQLIGSGSGGTGVAATPVYVTVAAHIEDNMAYTRCDVYADRREKLIAFAQAVVAAGATLNVQSDYEFLAGAKACETNTLKASTDGLSLFDYLARTWGVALDPHQEGATEDGAVNYADVRKIGGEVSATAITDTLGGILWDDTAQLAKMQAGEAGLANPGTVWRPTIATLGVSTRHASGDFSSDDLSSGVWRPKGGGTDFYTDDPASRIVYVGPGMQHSSWGGAKPCDFRTGAEYVQVLARYIRTGTLPADRIYTSTIAVPESVMFDTSKHYMVTDMIAQLDSLVASGEVVFATYAQVVASWKSSYRKTPAVTRYDAIKPADYTCR